MGSVPLTIAIYIWVVRRRCRFAARYSSLSLIQEAVPAFSPLRRHLPFVLFLLALTSLAFSLGRPITPETVLTGQTTIMLALDVSRSMCMQDITPNRLEVARAAALSFVQQPVLGTQVGIVAFAGFAELAQKPTTDVRRLEETLISLTTATETAIGSAILSSLDAIAKVDDRVRPSDAVDALTDLSSKQVLEEKSRKREYLPHIIVLLTDGASNTGPPPLVAAQQAAERGVRIYPIGFGTTNVAIMDCWNRFPDDPPGVEDQVGGGSFGNGPDEATLRQIAEMTGGKFYSASSAPELQTVFQDLHNYVAMSNKTIEVSVFFAAIGVIMVVAAWMLSMLWHPLL
jgi:Ca-activated chloride channel family protein